ncbi:hypothetical protein COE15_17950 [Bacillus cereus]|nr:hypothetical protein CN288_17465 [Bacillus sp. AFS023182]PGX97292.1 hypothetical protein COE15_17950 [Bacillus cereus]
MKKESKPLINLYVIGACSFFVSVLGVISRVIAPSCEGRRNRKRLRLVEVVIHFAADSFVGESVKAPVNVFFEKIVNKRYYIS